MFTFQQQMEFTDLQDEHKKGNNMMSFLAYEISMQSNTWLLINQSIHLKQFTFTSLQKAFHLLLCFDMIKTTTNGKND